MELSISFGGDLKFSWWNRLIELFVSSRKQLIWVADDSLLIKGCIMDDRLDCGMPDEGSPAFFFSSGNNDKVVSISETGCIIWV